MEQQDEGGISDTLFKNERTAEKPVAIVDLLGADGSGSG